MSCDICYFRLAQPVEVAELEYLALFRRQVVQSETYAFSQLGAFDVDRRVRCTRWKIGKAAVIANQVFTAALSRSKAIERLASADGQGQVDTAPRDGLRARFAPCPPEGFFDHVFRLIRILERRRTSEYSERTQRSYKAPSAVSPA